MEFYQKLRKLRKEQGMSQEELANQLSVSRQAVSKWESSQGFPETDKLLMLGNIFGVSLDYLLKDNEDQEVGLGHEAGYYVSREMVDGYLTMKKHGARRIAFGVAIMVLSISFTILFEDAIGDFLFFLGIAAGVAVLVLQGFQQKRYKELEEQPLIFDADFLKEFRGFYSGEIKRNGILIVVGIMLFIASYALNVLIEDVLHLDPRYEALYPILWSSAIAILITSGSAIISCDVIVKNKEHIEELRSEQKFSWIFAIGFLIATAIFLVIGIIWSKWNPSWIVFPTAALLCTAIAVWRKSKEK